MAIFSQPACFFNDVMIIFSDDVKVRMFFTDDDKILEESRSR